ncbi:MAG: hypothetical protein AB1696_12230 [Planctomycetota bacterium]
MSTTDRYQKPVVIWRPFSFLLFGLLITAAMAASYLKGSIEELRADIARAQAATRSALSRVSGYRRQDHVRVKEIERSLRFRAAWERACQRRYSPLRRPEIAKNLSDRIAAIPGLSDVRVGPREAESAPGWPARSPFRSSGGPAPGRGAPPRIQPLASLLGPSSGAGAALFLRVTCWCERDELYRALARLDALDMAGSVVEMNVHSKPDQPDHFLLEFVYCVETVVGSRPAWPAPPAGRVAKIKDHIPTDLAKAIAEAKPPGAAPPVAERATEDESKKIRTNRIIASKRYPEESIAVANGLAVRAGDLVDGMLVDKVEADGIVLRNGPKLIKIMWERRQEQ